MSGTVPKIRLIYFIQLQPPLVIPILRQGVEQGPLVFDWVRQ
jgi:hypothetical protein